jgi:hypothetical protein
MQSTINSMAEMDQTAICAMFVTGENGLKQSRR